MALGGLFLLRAVFDRSGNGSRKACFSRRGRRVCCSVDLPLHRPARLDAIYQKPATTLVERVQDVIVLVDAPDPSPPGARERWRDGGGVNVLEGVGESESFNFAAFRIRGA